MSIFKRNGVNWAKNDGARAVFVAEVKIRKFVEITILDILAEILIPQYGPNFGAIDPIFFSAA